MGVRRRCCNSLALVAWCAAAWIAAIGPSHAQLPAFPGAEGAGAFARGGRASGNVYVVTNLNNSGQGSFRHAIDTAPAAGRMIVFGVSGTINLDSDINIDSPYITIAGQSAPAGGITLARRALRISNTHNIILQHIRVRPGDYATAPNVYEPDSIGVISSNNVILDHVSASWSTDEVLSVTHGSTNVTVQWSLITEALHNSNHSKGNHGYGGIIHGGETTLHHNLYANNRSRNPATGNWDKDAPITAAHLDIVNNVISNPGDRYSYSGGDDQYQVNWAGNYGIEGPNTTRENELFHPDNVNSFVYYAGNYYDTTDDGILQLTPAGSNTLTGTFTTLPGPVATTNPPAQTDAPTAYQQVLSYAGAAAWRDPVDKRIINGVINEAGDHIDSQDEVGGYYYPTSQVHALDADGLPDAWKIQRGFSPSDNTVGLQVGPSGYTYLEEYLHELNAPYRPPAGTTPISVTTADGAGADAQLNENGGGASGDGSGPQLNARWTGAAGTSNQVIALRFDLSQVVQGSIADAALELTAFRAMSGQTLRIYGVEHDAANQLWDEASATFANVPGLAFDGNSGTRSLDSPKLLLLGEVATGNLAEGATLTLDNPDLAVFLNLLAYRTDASDSVTLLIERQNNSATEARFASAEGTALETGSPAAAGTYAPRLQLDAAVRPEGDFNGDGAVDAADLSIWGSGFGAEANANWRQGDANSDGDIDGNDLLTWQRQAATGHVAATTSTAVPEPSTIGLLAVAVSVRRMAIAVLQGTSGARQ
jgi:hypothetical protein